jgi:hypothetical protein
VSHSTSHPVDDGGPEYIIDPGVAASIVSTLLQLVLSLVGEEKAKAALDWETVQAANAAADATKVATDAAAYAVLKARGIVP